MRNSRAIGIVQLYFLMITGVVLLYDLGKNRDNTPRRTV